MSKFKNKNKEKEKEKKVSTLVDGLTNRLKLFVKVRGSWRTGQRSEGDGQKHRFPTEEHSKNILDI